MNAVFRPGPPRILPDQAPGGLVLNVYDLGGELIVSRKLGLVGQDIEELLQQATLAAREDADLTVEFNPEGVILVAFDGDTGRRWTTDDWRPFTTSC